MQNQKRHGIRSWISAYIGANLRPLASVLLALQLSCFPLVASPGTVDKQPPADKPAATGTPDVVLTTMKAELNRAKTDLAKSDPAPYFLSYTVYDQDQILIAGAYGGILSNSDSRRRTADVTMRVGTPQFDNTHGRSRLERDDFRSPPAE